MPTPESASAAAYGQPGGLPYGSAPQGGAPGGLGFGVSIQCVKFNSKNVKLSQDKFNLHYCLFYTYKGQCEVINHVRIMYTGISVESKQSYYLLWKCARLVYCKSCETILTMVSWFLH